MECSILFFLWLLGFNSFAQTIYYVRVDGSDMNDGKSWVTAYATISKAISSSVQNDEIRVGQGTFNSTATYTITISLKIKGGFNVNTGLQDYSNKTVLDGKNTYRIMRSYWTTTGAVPNVTIDGLKFVNANSSGYSGAVVFDKNTGVISNCEFSANASPVYGGGGVAIVNSTSKSTIVNCNFNNNSGKDGGAIYCGTGTILDILNCTIANNNCGSGVGGGIYNNGTISIKNCILWGNKKSEISNQIDGAGSFDFDHNIVEGGLKPPEEYYVSPNVQNIQSHQLLQQNSDFTVIGKGTPNQQISIHCSWEDASSNHFGTVAPDGTWSVVIRTPTASFTSHTIDVNGADFTDIFTDILVGEVWLCSGQSNMVFMVKDVVNANQEVADANKYPNIRLLNITRSKSDTPLDSIMGVWQTCSSTTITNFSAVAYFYGRKLQQELNVPIGLINASWGDTTAEVWVNRDSVLNTNDEDVLVGAMRNDNTPRVTSSTAYKIGSAYNAMIYPLHNMPVAGAIWYQGESNQGYPYYYPGLLQILVKNWRALWNVSQDEFPFYVAQICPRARQFDFKTYYSNPKMRFMQQRASELIANSGVECNDDIGDLNDIHPQNKQDVGLRFAYLALNKKYNVSSYDNFLSPLFSEYNTNGNQVTVMFRNVGTGLKTMDGQSPTQFEICGEDRIFYPAEAVIEGTNKVKLTSASVTSPVAVRLGWSFVNTTNLTSSENLPVAVFKTYDWEETSEE